MFSIVTARARAKKTTQRLASLEITRVNYRITELNEWVIVYPSGKAQNNEPLRVKYLFHRWLSHAGIRVIVNLKQVSQLGVWELELLSSFKEEVEERGGTLRICSLKSVRQGCLKSDCLTKQFDIYRDLEHALEVGLGNRQMLLS